MNMKNILRLMGVLTLTTAATTSVVACGDKAAATMNVEVSKQLNLTDEKGEGLKTLSLNTTVNDNVTWTISNLSKPINASELLTADNSAVNQACADFITGKLKQTAKDGKFNKIELDKITGAFTDFKPELARMDDGKDYAITGGTFNFQFKKDEEPLGDVYRIKLKVDKTKGVIAGSLSEIAAKIKKQDTDVATNSNILFIKDGLIPEGAKKGAAISIVIKSDNGKQFIALNTLTRLKISAQMELTDSVRTWEDGKKFEISYKTDDVNFDPTIVKTTLTVS